MVNNEYGYRRQVRRQPCYLKGSCFIAEGISEEMRCEDISAKGVGVRTTMQLPLNAQVKLDLITKNSQHLGLEGRVCWCSKQDAGYRAGIQFNKDIALDIKNII